MFKLWSKENRANTITYTRLIGCVAMLVIAPINSIEGKYCALFLCLYLGITDMLDGMIARSRYGKITELGKKLDPLADKIAIIVIYSAILWHRMIPLWLFTLIISRDFFINYLRGSAEKKGVVISARISGKIKTIIAFGLAFILLARIPVQYHIPTTILWPKIIIDYIHLIPETIVFVIMYMLALVTIATIVEYLLYYKKVMALKKA